MPARLTCPDDPTTLLRQNVCLSAVSKDLAGKLALVSGKPYRCKSPECVTFKTVHGLSLEATAHRPCDSRLARELDGAITVRRLVTVFDQDALRRGFHAGDFIWTGAAGLRITGRISGMTNVGTMRKPVFSDCQQCDQRGVMQGRLCGNIVATRDPRLKGCQVIAAYEIRWQPSDRGGSGAARGTVEGVITCPCQ